MSEKVLVTGGGGFLGRYIVEGLLEEGFSVRVLGRREYPFYKGTPVESFQADLADRTKVFEAVAGVQGVFHVGALAGFWGDEEKFHRTNVLGTRHILEACREYKVSKLVHTSSPSVVFDGNDMEGVDESVPLAEHFESPYPKTKAQAEREVLAANGQDGLATCALRPHLIFGPRDNHILPRILERGRAGKLRIIGDGRNKVDVTYVENAARAHLQAYRQLEPGGPVAGKSYFLSQGEPVVLWDFINHLLEAHGIPRVTRQVKPSVAGWIGLGMEMVYKGLHLPGEPRMTRFLARELSSSHWFDISASRRDFGYDPEAIPTEEALRRTIEASSQRPGAAPS